MTSESRLKKFGEGFFATVVFFTFCIPVIPVGAVEAWQHFNPSQDATSITAGTDSSTSPGDSSSSSDTSSYDDSSDSPTSDDTSSDYQDTPSYTDDTDDSSSADYSGYTNVDGNYVPSPNSTGATIGGYSPTYTCEDGSYSYAQHSQGACSYHGGVAY